jgi:hypothetical protein
MHCEIIPVRESDVCTARRLIEKTFGCLGGLRQTALILKFGADEEERTAVAPDPRGRTKSKDIQLVRRVAEPV